MKRRIRTSLQRTKIFLDHGGICHLCGNKIDAVKEGFELEHVIAFAMTHDDSDENLRPAHKACHKEKTKQDVADIAKAKRRQAKHLGAKVPKGQIKSRGFQSWELNVKFIERDFDT